MLKNEIQSTIKTGKKESDMINMSKKMISFTTKTLSFGVMVLLILFTSVTMTGSALPDNEGSGQMNSESVAVYVLDSGHHHLGDG